jgi:hypothetical protein
MNKVCSKCSCEYEHYGQRSLLCRPCKRTYDREYHHNRSVEAKLQKLSRNNDRRRKVLQFIWDYLASHPCSTCGEEDPIVLEFDHLSQEDKSENVSEMASFSLKRVKEEIGKCRVLCANCHRRHTALQLGWYKHISNIQSL